MVVVVNIGGGERSKACRSHAEVPICPAIESGKIAMKERRRRRWLHCLRVGTSASSAAISCSRSLTCRGPTPILCRLSVPPRAQAPEHAPAAVPPDALALAVSLQSSSFCLISAGGRGLDRNGEGTREHGSCLTVRI